MVSQRVTDIAVASYAKWHTPEWDLALMRSGYDEMLPDPIDGAMVAEDTLDGVPGLWVRVAESEPADVTFYLHGGGSFIGSARGYSGLASRIARSSRSSVMVLDFSLAPEATLIDQYDETVRAYRALISRDDVDPARVCLVGDSGGGGLALSLLLALRDAGDPLPACVAMMSPRVDLTMSGDTWDTLDGHDPMITRAAGEQAIEMTIGSIARDDVRVSPLFGDLAGLPPLLVQVGSAEVLLSDSIRLAEKARRAGVSVELQVAYEMMHVYQTFCDELPEAESSIEDLGSFLRAHVPTTTMR